MFKYQNVSKVDQTITGDGNIKPRIVKAGETVVSDKPLENPNFKYVGEEDSSKVQGVVTEPQPGAVTEASKLDNETNKEIQ